MAQPFKFHIETHGCRMNVNRGLHLENQRDYLAGRYFV